MKIEKKLKHCRAVRYKKIINKKNEKEMLTQFKEHARGERDREKGGGRLFCLL